MMQEPLLPALSRPELGLGLPQLQRAVHERRPGQVGRPNLWEDVLALHQHSPLHACVGGGDQVYSVSAPEDSVLSGYDQGWEG